MSPLRGCACCESHPTTSLSGCPTHFRFCAEEGEDLCAMCARAWRAASGRAAAKRLANAPVCFAQPAALPRWVASWPLYEDGTPALAPFLEYLCDREIVVTSSLGAAPLDGAQLPDGVRDAENGRLFTYWRQVVTCPACKSTLAQSREAA